MKEILKNKRISEICIRIINLIIPIKSLRKQLRQKIYNYLLEELIDEFAKKYPDYYQFAMFNPWGNFYIPCALFDEFKRKNNFPKILAVCSNTNQEQVLQSISAIDKIVKIDLRVYNTIFDINNAKKYVQKLEKGKLYCLSHWLFSEAVNNKSINFLELYTKMLGLEYPAKLCVQDIMPILKEDYSKTAFIYPEATSFVDNEIPNNFWRDLAVDLSSMGYDVIFNTKEKIYGNFKTVFLPMYQTIQLAMQCGCIIGMRSGLSDILAINKVKNHIVIYPQNMYFKTITKEQQEQEFSRAFVIEENKTFEDNMYRITSLRMFNSSAIELKFSNSELLKKNIKDILLKLDNNKEIVRK